MYGRDGELRMLSELLDRAQTGRGGSLVLRGVAGSGKSALLEWASRAATDRGMRLIGTAGFQAEVDVPYAGLSRVLRLEVPPETLPHRAALLALDSVTTCPPGEAVLLVVEDAQWLDRPTWEALAFIGRRFQFDPVLALIAMRDSAETARRLAVAGLPEFPLGPLSAAAAAALLDEVAPESAAPPPESAVPGLTAALPEETVPDLAAVSMGAAISGWDAALPEGSAVGSAPVARGRILAEARGNPLALIELAKGLTPRTTRVFAAITAEFAESTRVLLEVAAFSAGDSLDEILAVGSRVMYGAEVVPDTVLMPGDVEAAVAAGLVTVDDGFRLRWLHPLARSAIRANADVARRSLVHDAFAEMLAHDPDRRVWHQAASVAGPDETLAGELAEAAARLRRRDSGLARAMLERAAELSPVTRAGRLFAALEIADQDGDREASARIADRIGALELSPAERVRLSWIRALSLAGQGQDPARAASLAPVVRALGSGPKGGANSGPKGEADGRPKGKADSGPKGEADSAPKGKADGGPKAEADSEAETDGETDGETDAETGAETETGRVAGQVAGAVGEAERALESLLSLAAHLYLSNLDTETRERFAETVAALDVPASDARRLCVLAVVDPVRWGASIVKALRELLHGVDSSPRELSLLGSAAHSVGVFPLSLKFFALAAFGLRAQGRPGAPAWALVGQAVTAGLLGDARLATAAGSEAIALARDSGQTVQVTLAEIALAMADALQGNTSEAFARSARAEAVLLSSGAHALRATIDFVRGVAALANGDVAEAFGHFGLVVAAAPTTVAQPHLRFAALSLYAEAAAACGELAALQTVVDDLEPLARTGCAPVLEVTIAYARAVLAPGEAGFEAALAADLSEWPFERARLQLAYGTWLRRNRRGGARSRPLLRDAARVLDALGADAWVRRARRELRASGESPDRSASARGDMVPGRPATQLTPQEVQVARLAAAGLSNREIAERLFLSPRTVTTHLTRIFPKLGIASRRELPEAMRRYPDT